MPENIDDMTMAERLEALGITDFDEDIFTMSSSKLRSRFRFETVNSINTSLLIKNLIWQDHGKIQRGELEPFHGNIRSYWYARVKPVLVRAKAKKAAKKYDMMINQFLLMTLHYQLFDYGDFGFTDEGAHNRRLGSANRHIFLVAEKSGHMPLLQELQADYDVTIVALGGQPSALSSEYFVSELDAADFTPDASTTVPLLTIVDYDAAGDSIANSFIWQLHAVGLDSELDRVDLVDPSRMTPEQIKLNKYPLSKKKSERKKNRKWAGKTGGLTAYGHGALWGLEADAMSWKQLIDAFDQQVSSLLGVPRALIVRRRLKRELVEVLRELLLIRLGVA